MHNANADKSKRLQVLLRILRSNSRYGISTINIQHLTQSMAVATDVSELRQNGYEVRCSYVGKTPNGRRIFKYRIVEEN